MSIDQYFYRTADHLRDLLPKPVVDNVEGDRLGMIQKIDVKYLSGVNSYTKNQIVALEWTRLYDMMVSAISRAAIGRDEYFVFRLIPGVRPMDENFQVAITLQAELLIAKSREFVIPTFVYRDNVAVEWRCGHCQIPNPMEATYCGEKHKHAVGCGAPRALLIQEMIGRNG